MHARLSGADLKLKKLSYLGIKSDLIDKAITKIPKKKKKKKKIPWWCLLYIIISVLSTGLA